MKIVKHGYGKATVMAGGEVDLEVLIDRYQIVKTKAEKICEGFTEGTIQEELINPLMELTENTAVKELIGKLKGNGLIEEFLIKIAATSIVSMAIKEVVEKGDVTLNKAILNVELTQEDKKEVMEKTYDIISEEIQKELMSSAIMGLLFPGF